MVWYGIVVYMVHLIQSRERDANACACVYPISPESAFLPPSTVPFAIGTIVVDILHDIMYLYCWCCCCFCCRCHCRRCRHNRCCFCVDVIAVVIVVGTFLALVPQFPHFGDFATLLFFVAGTVYPFYLCTLSVQKFRVARTRIFSKNIIRF